MKTDKTSNKATAIVQSIHWPKKAGQATVEFALVGVILLALLFGILEISRLLFMNAELENAAREGAHYAALHPGILVPDPANQSCLRHNAITPTLTLLDGRSASLAIQVDDPQGVTLGSPLTVTLTNNWTSIVNIMPDMSTWTLRPLGPLRLEARSMRFIEIPDARTDCP